jgi:hypothetical protein
MPGYPTNILQLLDLKYLHKRKVCSNYLIKKGNLLPRYSLINLKSLKVQGVSLAPVRNGSSLDASLPVLM